MKPTVSDWKLERLARGELSADEAKKVRAALEAAGELGRLEALARSNDEILAQHPPANVAREVKRRLARAEVKKAPARLWVGLALPLAAAAALVLVLRPASRTGDDLGDETIYTKGLKPELRVYRKSGAQAEALKPRAKVRKGDMLHLRYIAAGQRYGVIASIDARGTVNLHLPEVPGKAASLAPSGERALAHSYELDDSPGFETFVFVTSDQPFDTEAAVSALRGTPPSGPFRIVSIQLDKVTP